jgi:hypothetical protein
VRIVTKPWTTNAQPNRAYGHNFNNQGTGGPAGMVLQPNLTGVGNCVCGKELGTRYWVQRGRPFCGKSACAGKMAAGGGS